MFYICEIKECNMKEALENLKCVINYSFNEENKSVDVYINDEDYYFKYQLETFLYFTDKTYTIKTTLVKQ